ncbi:GFA family protein [Jannaschia aquimarina]|uniref:Glutathione-dependent formaldehyde-activating enzyme n=1 Tax=Jannaschia aquimarina TaxID=935700 RepID=A0A0D1EC47_9RHOB|nr:GFA family protein [Jannaschia aquimarina]KIT14476.1 Glutathione-dependent formaldehyde-activating enzyme [Jannaschia aquimarina]SNT28842.1 Uncharacterized conserved protein [Jannaschia aquimarina]
MVKGSCLCGAIRFEIDEVPGPVTACHCGQCSKSTGNYAMATPVPWTAIRMEGTPRWYASSETGRRGFCGSCGSYLFWEEGDGMAYVSAGALDGAEDLPLDGHLHYADRGDWYRIDDGRPHWRTGRRSEEVAP